MGPSPAHAVIESEVLPDLPGVLQEPFGFGLAHVGAVALIGFGVAVKDAQSGVGEGVIGVEWIAGVFTEIEGAAEDALFAFVFTNAVDVAAELDQVRSVGDGDVVVE